MEINEAEEYLGLLREKQAAVQRRLKQADDQIGIVRDALRSDGITEQPSEDEEGMYSDESHDHSSSEDDIPPPSSCPPLHHPQYNQRTSTSSLKTSESSDADPSATLHSILTTPSIGGTKEV